MAADAFGHVCGGRQFFAQWLGEPLHGVAMPLRQHPSPSTGGGLGGPLPAPGWEGRRGGRGGRAEAPRQQGHCGQALTTRGGKAQLPPGPQPLRGPQGEPLDGPAVSIHRLRLCPAARERRMPHAGVGTAGGVDDHPGQRRGARGRRRAPPGVPALRGDPPGRRWGAPLPGRTAGRGRGRLRTPCLRAWAWTAQRACGGAASRPTVGGQRGPSGRTVAGSPADRPRDLGRVARRQWAPPSGPAGFVRGAEARRVWSPRRRHSAVAWRVCVGR